MDTEFENACLAVPADVVSCPVGDETVLLALDSGVYFGLEGVGTRVWELLSGGTASARAIWRVLVDEYEVDPERCWDDVVQFLGEMRSRGLVRLEQVTANASGASSQQG